MWLYEGPSEVGLSIYLARMVTFLCLLVVVVLTVAVLFRIGRTL